jgi:ribokinase
LVVKGELIVKDKEKMLERIEDALTKTKTLGTVTVLPDYFVDRFVRIDDFDKLAAAISRKGEEGGGGSIRGIRQTEVKGGNAVNLGYSLAVLGIKTNVITIANSLSAEALRATFRRFQNVDLDIIEGEPGYTVAMEFMKDGKIVNVMVSDAGDLKDFDQTKLEEHHWQKIMNSDLVSVLNWAAIPKGTDLTLAVFERAKEIGIPTFFDPADVLEKAEDLPDLKKRVVDKGLIDYFSLNENEARITANVLAGHKLPQDFTHSDLHKTIRILADITGETVDIHTVRLSISCRDKEVSTVKCHNLEQKTITGAGDVWDAADIIGYRAGLDVEERLTLANAAGGLFISRENAIAPENSELMNFIRNTMH